VSKIMRHHLKSNLWTVSLGLYNHVVEVCRRTPCERSK